MLNRIVLITNEFPPIGGGISRYLYEIANHLPHQLVCVIGLATRGWEDFDDKQDFPVKRLCVHKNLNQMKYLKKFLAPVYFAKLIREKHTDIVLCGVANYNLTFPAWLNSRLRGTPYVVFVHGLDLLSKQMRWYRYFFNAVLRSANLLIANSQATLNLIQKIGVDPKKIFVLNPSINPDRFINNISPETIRQRYELMNKKCILSVGRLVKRKGHDIILKAMPSILQEVPNTSYLIVGSGPNEDSLRKLVIDLGLENHVIFSGQVPDEELGAYYSICDVFAMISREIPEKGSIEGFGIVYLEANLFGKPVVAGRSGGVEDAVIHNKTGLLLDPTSSKEAAAAIISLLTKPEYAHRLGEYGHKRVINKFSSKVSAQKLLDILSSKYNN